MVHARLAGWFALTLLAVSSGGCAGASGDAARPDAVDGSADGLGQPGADDGGAVDGGTEGASEQSISVSGQLLLDVGIPIPHHLLTEIDVTHAQNTTLTDDAGNFTFTHVTPPYSIGVVGPTSFFYLGLRATNVAILGEPDTLPSAPHREATLMGTIATVACGTATCPTTIWTHSDPRGQGGYSTTYNANVPSLTYPIQHYWGGDPTATVTMNVMISDASYSKFWYATVEGLQVTDGAATSFSTVSPTQVPSSGTLTATVSQVDIPASWGQPQVAVYLNYPNNGGQANLAFANTLVLSSGIPNIPGATLTVSGYASDPNQASTSSARVGPLALTTTSTSLTLAKGPDLQPPANAHIHASGTIAWTPHGMPGVYEVFLSSAQGQPKPALVFLTDTKLALPDLTALGAHLPAGSYHLDVAATQPFTSLDAFAASVANLALYTGAADTRETFTIDP